MNFYPNYMAEREKVSMIKKLTVDNFKCFHHMELELKPVTVLCGMNSGGKSSVIQALLLARESEETGEKQGNLDLMNSKYNVNLYSFDEILYEDAEEEIFHIAIQTQGCEEKVYEYRSEEGDNNLKYQRRKGEPQKEDKTKIWYLSSDRTISPYQRRGNAEALELGADNEYMGFILEKGRSGKIVSDKNKNCRDMDNVLFTTQVNEWLDFILPGNQVMAAALGNDNLISLRFGKEQKLHKTNVGYGVSFVLPILVGGLLAAKGDILIVENPELHLHPKAQSDLMLFLSTMAIAGVQIVIETHSDHIINGIRKAVVSRECRLQAEDAAIYFFGKHKTYHFIRMDSAAELSEWPEDFMEQEENDLYYIRRMRKLNDTKRTNEHTKDV